MPSVAQVETPGIGPRKTLFVMVTVVGCIAILWPKVFYPMMFGATPKQTLVKDHRGAGCCDVVLDRESFMNETLAGPQLYRKRLNLFTGEISLRQERPPHLRTDSIHPAMRERGRAIPSTQTVPVVERAKSTQPPPRIVEGRPGPIPGMRPPMGAGSVHQAQPKGSSMGLIMPLYTVGIIAFFIYTLMKIVFKKQVPNAPYGPVRPDPNFRREVFGQESNDIPRRPQPMRGPQIGCNHHHHVHDPCHCRQKHANGEISSSYISRSAQQIVANPTANATNIGVIGNGISATAGRHYGHIGHVQEREQLMEIEKLRKKLEETEKAMAILIAEMNCDRYKAKETPENVAQTENISNGHATAEDSNDISSKLAEPGENLKDKNENLEKPDEYVNGKSEEVDDGGAASLQDETEKILKEAIEEIKREKIRDSKKESDDFIKHEKPSTPRSERKKREGSGDRAAMVLGMELTASCEGGHKWGRPPTPVFISHHEHSHEDEIDKPEPQSIYLEGSLPHESQILVSDAETRTENVIDDDINGSPDEPAVVLSSKMTLSLINLCSSSTEEDEIEEDEKSGSPEEKDDSPLDEDMEIINGDEKEVDKVKKQESTEEE